MHQIPQPRQMEEEIRKQYEIETGKKWFTVPFTRGEQAFASWGYQLWLEKKISQVEPEVKVNFAERIIEEEIEKLEKLANEYNEDMDTEGYINNLNDSNILHRVLIRIKSESKISA